MERRKLVLGKLLEQGYIDASSTSSPTPSRSCRAAA